MKEFESPVSESPVPQQRAMAPWVKFTLELGPLLLFFFANSRPKLFSPLIAPFVPAKMLEGENAGLYTATGVLMIAVVAALIVSYVLTRRLPVMPVVTAVLVVIFGGLTFYFQDPSFIKMKPTILYACFGLALLGGLVFNRPLLPIVLDNAMTLTERGWRILTLRWGMFFVVLAVLNEIVWRTQSNDHWVLFKFPGTVILIFVFTFSQVPLIMKHELHGDAAAKAPDHL